MNKSSMLNSNINRILSELGHTDQIVIADAGLPVPSNVERIDIALIKGIPSFIETLKAVLPVMQIERIILAGEIVDQNPEIHVEILALVEHYSALDEGKKPINVDYVSHEDFKIYTKHETCKAVIRTGECTPYANIILEAGVVF